MAVIALLATTLKSPEAQDACLVTALYLYVTPGEENGKPLQYS